MATDDMIPLMIKPSEADKARRAFRRALRPVRGPGVHDDDSALFIGGDRRGTPRFNEERPARMRVKTIANDYWGCVLWDGTTEGTKAHDVALLPELRADLSYWQLIESTITSLARVDAQTVTASFSGDADDETWKITPSIAVNCEVWAMRVSGGTGVNGSDGAPTHWLLMSPGRAMAKDNE